jgi:hypothetical protein
MFFEQKIGTPGHVLQIAILFVFALIVSPKQTYAQSSVSNQVWLDFNPIYQLSDKFNLISKVGVKASVPDVWYKYYLSSEVDFRLPKVLLKKLKRNEKVYAGTYFYYIENIGQPNSIELSPYQGYKLMWPNQLRLIIEHKAELTERFQWQIDKADYSFGLQLSYEGSFVLNFPGKAWKNGDKFYLTANIKLWWNLLDANTFNDLARIMPGIGYNIDPAWKAAFIVGWNYTKDQSDEQFSNNSFIYRLRVYYLIPKKKK